MAAQRKGKGRTGQRKAPSASAASAASAAAAPLRGGDRQPDQAMREEEQDRALRPEPKRPPRSQRPQEWLRQWARPSERWGLVSVGGAKREEEDPRLAKCTRTSCLRVFGERHTATNWLVRLLDRNLNVTILSKWPDSSWVWKHTMPPPPRLASQRPILVVTITKNPYSWLRSLYRVPYEYVGAVPTNFSAFLRASWRKLPSGREHWAPASFGSPVHLWGVKNRAYTEIRVPVLVNLKYEALVDDPERELLHLGARLGAPWKAKRFVNIVEAKRWESRNTRRTFAEHRRYYMNELWKASYTGERAAADLRYIGEHLDHGVMARFGYKLLRKCVAMPAYGSTARRALCKEEAPAREHFPRYPSTKDARAPNDVWKGHVA